MTVDPADFLPRLGVPEPTSVEAVSGGADGLLWRVRSGALTYALRVLGPDRQAQANREVTLLRSLAGSEIPVPGVRAVAIEADRPAYLMDWVDGRPLAERLLDPAATDAVRSRLMIEFGRLQALINARTGPALDDGPDWIARRGDPVPGATGPARLLHLDYHPLNVMVRDDRIVAVLDWANATLGDPRYDRARTESILALMPDPDGTLEPLLAQGIADWRTGYGDPTPPGPEFRRWAGAAMAADLAPRVGDPGVPWLTPTHLARIRAYR